MHTARFFYGEMTSFRSPRKVPGSLYSKVSLCVEIMCLTWFDQHDILFECVRRT